MKKIILILLFFGNNVSLQAEDLSWYSFLGSLFGNLLSSNNSLYNSNAAKCTCGEYNYNKLENLDCCGAIICKSCLVARRHTALIKKISPKCHACGKSFDYDMVEQYHHSNNQITPEPSAPPANCLSNNVPLCASGCNSRLEIRFTCGHGMCRSCLRSRIDKARKQAQGNEPYVTCPKCGDMLMSTSQF